MQRWEVFCPRPRLQREWPAGPGLKVRLSTDPPHSLTSLPSVDTDLSPPGLSIVHRAAPWRIREAGFSARGQGGAGGSQGWAAWGEWPPSDHVWRWDVNCTEHRGAPAEAIVAPPPNSGLLPLTTALPSL